MLELLERLSLVRSVVQVRVRSIAQMAANAVAVAGPVAVAWDVDSSRTHQIGRSYLGCEFQSRDCLLLRSIWLVLAA
jgi:hypothetical protein